MYERIVAGTDLSRTAAIATDRAALLASRVGASRRGDRCRLRGPLGGRSSGGDAHLGRGRRGVRPHAVGSVGMRGPKRFMLGNVPERVSHHAPTDVLIFKTA
jgi:nucleotide-binding universal stress UspA family protein